MNPDSNKQRFARTRLRTTTLTATVLLSLALAGCSTQDVKQVGNAATAPLHDLNLVKEEIPAVLQAARSQPYATPEDASCAQLQQLITTLDSLLGPDLDAPKSDVRPSLLDRGAQEAKNSVVKMISQTTEGAVPFRGWVRKLSGAERHSRNTEAAITAGAIRRAYLKGLRSAGKCE